eukprot:scaffold43339_cov32-Tisochrysis_lutea.AAC.2
MGKAEGSQPRLAHPRGRCATPQPRRPPPTHRRRSKEEAMCGHSGVALDRRCRGSGSTQCLHAQ